MPCMLACITDQLSILETILETSSHYNYKTRQEASGVLRQVPGAEARLDLAERCWCWRAAKTYHTLPVGIKNLVKQAKFKVESMGDEKCGTLSNSISTVKLRLGKKFDYLALFYVL